MLGATVYFFSSSTLLSLSFVISLSLSLIFIIIFFILLSFSLYAFKVMVFKAAYGLVGLQRPSFSVLWIIETGLTQILQGC